MPQQTNAEKRLARIHRLIAELQAKAGINTDSARTRCIAACRELIEQLKAEDAFQRRQPTPMSGPDPGQAQTAGEGEEPPAS